MQCNKCMKRTVLFFVCSIYIITARSQTVTQKLQNTFQEFEAGPQLRSAIASLYVIDAANGNVVFDRNSTIGLAPASTQKIITSTTAYTLLGSDFIYQTALGYDGQIVNGVLKGNLYLTGSGDPTLGSWRYAETKRENVLNNIAAIIKQKGINRVEGHFYIDESHFSFQPTPGGWIWDDIGNYYGAGCWGLNWNENQYDMVLKPGKNVGDTTTIISTEPEAEITTVNGITTGRKGSGDNGYIYTSPYSSTGFTTGTIPAGVNSFTISGSLTYPAKVFANELQPVLAKNNIQFTQSNDPFVFYIDKVKGSEPWPKPTTTLGYISSPSFDSIIYWFLKKSINLYGEALLKTISYHQSGYGATDDGVDIVRKFWKEKGLAETELNIVDGSGLSPLNRVTTHAQVTALQYARTQPWYKGFYNALPEYNGMKMKSGTIHAVKGFAGYQTSKNGTTYIFSFLVNNYNGSSSSLVQKMYNILDILKD